MKQLAEYKRRDASRELEEKKAELAKATDTRPGRGRHAEMQATKKMTELKVDTGVRSMYTSVPARARGREHERGAAECSSRYGMGTGICPSGLLLKLLGFRPLSFVLSCLVRGEHTGCRCSRPRRRPRRRAARARRAGGRTSPRRPS